MRWLSINTLIRNAIKFRRKSILFRMIASYLILIIVAVILISFVYIYAAKNILIDEVSKSNQEVLSQVSSNISLLLQNMTERINTLSVNQDVINILYREKNWTKKEYENKMFTDFQTLVDIQNILKIMYSNVNIYNTENNTIAIVNNKDVVFTSWENNTYDFNKLIGELSAMNLRSNELTWIPTHQSFNDTEKQSFTLVKNLVDEYAGNNLGYIMISMSNENLYKLYYGFLSENDQRNILIVTDRGELISSSIRTDTTMNQDYISAVTNNTSPFSGIEDKDCFVRIKGTNMFIVRSQIPVTNWTIYSFVPVNSLLGRLKTLLWVIILVLSIVFLLASFYALKYSTYFYKRVDILRNAMAQVNYEKLPVKSTSQHMDEMDDLMKSYNAMVDSLKKNMEQVLEEQHKNLVEEMNFLQAQINTHFLYNVLNSIKLLAYTKRTDEIYQMVTSLVRLLRVTLSSKSIITIQEEIKYTQDYLCILKIRYANDFNMIINIEEDVNNFGIPKLLVQPIVENAVIHGLKGNKNNKIIKLNIHAQEDRIHIVVEDNGSGIDKSLIDKFSQYQFRGVGLGNVNTRLKLYYGDEAKLKITSVIQQGTHIEIIIPKKTVDSYSLFL